MSHFHLDFSRDRFREGFLLNCGWSLSRFLLCHSYCGTSWSSLSIGEKLCLLGWLGSGCVEVLGSGFPCPCPACVSTSRKGRFHLRAMNEFTICPVCEISLCLVSMPLGISIWLSVRYTLNLGSDRSFEHHSCPQLKNSTRDTPLRIALSGRGFCPRLRRWLGVQSVPDFLAGRSSGARSGRALAAWGSLQRRRRLGCGRFAAGQRAGLGWALVLPFFHAPTPGNSVHCPPISSQRVPASIHGHSPASSSRTSPRPRPTGHGPRPARPAPPARAPPWRTWVSGARPAGPQPPTTAGICSRTLAFFTPPHPCLLACASVSARASSPNPRPPSCLSLPAFPGLAAPSLLPSLAPSALALGCWTRRCSARVRLDPEALGREGLRGPWVWGLG